MLVVAANKIARKAARACFRRAALISTTMWVIEEWTQIQKLSPCRMMRMMERVQLASGWLRRYQVPKTKEHTHS